MNHSLHAIKNNRLFQKYLVHVLSVEHLGTIELTSEHLMLRRFKHAAAAKRPKCPRRVVPIA